MATKPAQICQLQKGKLVDTQKGFVDTFNWAVQSIANLKGGENCDVTWPTDDHPTIDCTAKEGEGGSGGSGAAVYDVIPDVQDEVSGITIQYTDDREDSFIPFGSLSGVITEITADSNNPAAEFDSANQDYLTYTLDDGTTVDVALPYVNGVANLSALSSQTGDRQLTWSYTRSDTSVEPIDLGVEFTDETETSSTGTHTTIKLKSAQDSNVEFTFGDGELTIGVYYV